MFRNVTVILAFFCLFDFTGLARAAAGDEDPQHNTNTILFRSGQFKKIIGELWTPATDGKHPLVIMVHGDGPGYRSYYGDLKRCFLRAGYASFIWDKPGHGGSTGKFSKDRVLTERADVLLTAIAKMKKRDEIDPDHIGVWGVSQAGYVIPIAITRTEDVAFFIAVGCAGEDGVNQSSYFVEQQIVCEGVSQEEASRAGELFAGVLRAQTYDDYVANGTPLLEGFPIVKDLDVMAGILPEEDWTARDPNADAFFDPIEVLERTTIPVLAIWGEKDRNIDPVQGLSSYQGAMAKAGNQHYRLEVVPGADHDIILCDTGCDKERRQRTGKEWSNHAPEYLELMESWLRELSDG